MPIFLKPVPKILQSYVKGVEGIHHIPNSGGFIIAVNHNNHLDSFILSSVIQREFNRSVKFLSRKEIILWQIIGQWGADRLGAILIDFQKKEASLDVAFEALMRGEIIGNYPEARLNDTPVLASPRSGTARLALWTGFPVLPAGISEGPGAHSGLRLLSDILFNFKHSTRIKFGKVLQFDKFNEKFIPKELLERTSDEIMSAIAPLCGKTYTPNP